MGNGALPPSAITAVPLFDKAGAFERVDNDLELFAELIEMFFLDYPEVCSAIDAAFASNSGKQLEERAHSLKSALGNLGAMRSFEYAKSLEYSGRSGDFEQAKALWPLLKESVAEFQREAELIKTY